MQREAFGSIWIPSLETSDIIHQNSSGNLEPTGILCAYQNNHNGLPKQLDRKPSYLKAKLTGNCVPMEIECNTKDVGPLSPVKVVFDQFDDNIAAFEELNHCLSLLERDESYEECRVGMESLVKLVNEELVNHKLENSVSGALIFGHDLGCRSEGTRLRRILLSCFAGKAYHFYEDGLSSDSSESDNSSLSTKFDQDLKSFSSSHLVKLKIPALRILTSSLNLVTMDKEATHNIDLSSSFWVTLLGGMTVLGKIDKGNRLEAMLSIKCIRLLHRLEPATMKTYIQYSVLPYILDALESGKEYRDRALVREASSMLEQVGIQQTT